MGCVEHENREDTFHGIIHNGWPDRSPAAVRINAIACSIWTGVVKRPRLARTVEPASARLSPMASSTCDGSKAPDEHADPVPSITSGKFSNSASASIPGKVRLLVLGQALGFAGVDLQTGNAGKQRVLKLIAQAGDADAILAEFRDADTTGFPEADNPGHIGGAGAQPVLLSTSVLQGFPWGEPAAHSEHTTRRHP